VGTRFNLKKPALQSGLNQVKPEDRQAQIQATKVLKRARARFQAAGGLV
jgi:F-type H+-transporting ATPase subunit epsilon